MFLGVGESALSPTYLGGGLLTETETTIAPYAYTGEDEDGTAVLGAGLLDETLTTIGAAA